MGKKSFIPWSHEDFMKRELNKRGLAHAILREQNIKTITKRVHTGDKVITPKGIGKVHVIDDDDTICVDIDKSDILYEFDRKEVSLYKKTKKRR